MADRPPKKVPVSERALIQRINRILNKREEMIRKTRLDQWESQLRELGRYHVVHFRCGVSATLATDGQLEEYARELGALRDYEELAK